MSFLVLAEDNWIRPTTEGWGISEVNALYRNDNSLNKKDFYDTMKCIYYIHNPNTLFKNKSIDEKIKIVNEKYLTDSTYERIIRKKHAKEVEALYIDLVLTMNQRLWEKVKKDAVDFMEHLSSIPFVRQIEWSGDVIFEHEGEKKVVVVKKIIDIVNIDEKKKAMDTALKLSQILNQVETNLKQEETDEAVKRALSRMYDKRSDVPLVESYN